MLSKTQLVNRHESGLVKLVLSTVLVLGFGPLGQAQLQITELMFDPGSGDTDWEWFEVSNTGGTAIDLDSYWLDDLGEAIPNTASEAPSIINALSGGSATNTAVPAGGVAVVYDGAALAFDDQRFRSAWQLGAGVPLIAAADFPSLNNGGDAIGLWATRSLYDLDVIEDPPTSGTFVVGGFTNAAVSIDYRSGFPTGANSPSIYWDGTSPVTDGTNWQRSVSGEQGAVTSVETFLPGQSQLNGELDIGNPGVVPGGTPPAELLITEIMYNPRSDEADWEWVEIYNNTGSTIDFSTNPHVFDDAAGSALASENVVSGSIDDDATAVLFNDTRITLQNMREAWGAGLNYIPISSSWPSLNNSDPGDTLGLWSDLAEYTADEDLEMNRTFGNADVTVDYENGINSWPLADGNGSIHLKDLGGNVSLADSWALSASADGFSSFNPQIIFESGQPVDHSGGDIGSPGSFPGSSSLADGDFDASGLVDIDDLNLVLFNWSEEGATLPIEWVHMRPADVAVVSVAELNKVLFTWNQTGSSTGVVPEPSALVLAVMTVCGLALGHRRRATRARGELTLVIAAESPRRVRLKPTSHFHEDP